MDGLDSEHEKTISLAKTHEEIIEIIEEIKKYEKRFIGHVIEDVEVEFIDIDEEIVEFIEVKEDKLEEFVQIPINEETKKPGLKEKLKLNRIFKIKFKTQKQDLEVKPIAAATFKIRFNDAGELVNLDIKKSKSKPQSKKRYNLKKIKIRRKGKTERTDQEDETKEKKSKFSKFKEGFGKIGNLKKAIPHKKMKDKTEKTESEE